MATAVLLIIVALASAAGWRWWRKTQGDQRSVDAYHTMIDRLQQMDAPPRVDDRPGDGSPADPAAPQIRIIPAEKPAGGRRSGPRAPLPPAVSPTVVAPRADEPDDWGPPVRLLAESRADAHAPAPAGPAQAAAESRPVLFFDDLAARTERPEPAPAVIPIRQGDRPWLGTARQYAVPGAAALVTATVSLIALTVALSSGGGHRVVSSTRPAAGGSPTSRAVVAPPAPAPAPNAAPSPSSTSATAGSTPAPAAPAAPPTAGRPQLTQVSPASGVPGQRVTLAGAGLFSSSGLIIVRFGSAQAPVVCPNQTTCQATVPDTPGSPPTGAQEITVSTGAGTSNALTFTYT